ncbi:hypothetical protein O3M35_007561 [Rhynocoris fuscipes]|uniref:Uncharacterized protein n=1 Tax=Rhynocoris fuscipes TaxID=488301 RepID=A0AAW1D9V2_9HEMI
MDVKLYMKYNQLQTFDAKCILENLKGEFNGKHCEDVLDIGSGPGNVTAEVLRPFLTNDCNIVRFIYYLICVSYSNSLIVQDAVHTHLSHSHFIQIR